MCRRQFFKLERNLEDEEEDEDPEAHVGYIRLISFFLHQTDSARAYEFAYRVVEDLINNFDALLDHNTRVWQGDSSSRFMDTDALQRRFAIASVYLLALFRANWDPINISRRPADFHVRMSTMFCKLYNLLRPHIHDLGDIALPSQQGPPPDLLRQSELAGIYELALTAMAHGEIHWIKQHW